jgi:hypothetical protein
MSDNVVEIELEGPSTSGEKGCEKKTAQQIIAERSDRTPGAFV